MFIPSEQGADASTVSVASAASSAAASVARMPASPADATPPATADSSSPLPPQPPSNHHAETVRHMLFGSASAVQATIHHLHHLHYAEPNDWSQPISTGRPNEVTAILTKRIRVSEETPPTA